MRSIADKKRFFLLVGLVPLALALLTPRTFGATPAPGAEKWQAAQAAAARTWVALSDNQKISKIESLVKVYQSGWIDGYIAKFERDSPRQNAQAKGDYAAAFGRQIEADRPKFSRSLSEYSVEITRYLRARDSSAPGRVEALVACLADHPKSELAAICDAFHFPASTRGK